MSLPVNDCAATEVKAKTNVKIKTIPFFISFISLLFSCHYLLYIEPIAFIAFFSLPVKVTQQGVYPRYVNAKPSVFTDRLASKRQYEFAERILVERQPHVKEIDMGVVVFP